jgi:thioredoxin-related protein
LKKIFIAIVLLFSFLHGWAQEKEDSIPVYQRFPTVPPFTIMCAPDSTAFSKADLKKRRPVMIVVFSPDCEHCKHFTKELLAKSNLFKKATIVMASSLNYDLIKKFYDDDKIADYPNIKMGRDGTYFLSTFFKVRSYPTIFVYNKKGKFVERFEGTAPLEKMAAAL